MEVLQRLPVEGCLDPRLLLQVEGLVDLRLLLLVEGLVDLVLQRLLVAVCSVAHQLQLAEDCLVARLHKLQLAEDCLVALLRLLQPVEDCLELRLLQQHQLLETFPLAAALLLLQLVVAYLEVPQRLLLPRGDFHLGVRQHQLLPLKGCLGLLLLLKQGEGLVEDDK